MEEDRCIEVLDDFTDETRRICKEIGKLAAESDRPIILRIDSRGATDIAQEWVLNAMRESKAPVHGLVTKKAASAGFNILQHCVWRSSHPEAILMFHQPRISAEAASAYMGWPAERDFVIEDDPWYVEFLEYLAWRSGQDIEVLRAWGKEERCFSAIEALGLGFIDEVVAPSV